MPPYILNFQEIDKTQHTLVGGKGANLGELSRMDGIHVPEGFCVTTEAYQKIVRQIPELSGLLEQLSLIKVEDMEQVRELSKKIRDVIEAAPMEKEIEEAVTQQLAKLGNDNAYAVRSSATAEDLETASFAGQQDTYLNIIGKESILKHVSKCWASLFTDRAVIYRMQNGFDHRHVYLSVVIQKMVFPQVAGIVFTADPVTGNRKVVSIDASFGLGEALVSGFVNADNYKVRSGSIIEKKISTKKLAITPLKEGGTKEEQIKPDQQNEQALTDEQIVELESIGKKIEQHFGRPQDIEWCLVDDVFSIVQSRPITTLFPIPTYAKASAGGPETNNQDNHVYISVGHQQMMTDAMKPLGISVWQLTAARPMSTAGGRLFVDVAQQLATPAGRHLLINVLGKSDPLIKGALTAVVERDFIRLLPEEKQEPSPAAAKNAPPPVNFEALNDYDPSIVMDLIRKSEASIEEAKNSIQTKAGPELMDFILEDIQQMKKIVFDPQGSGVFMTAMNATSWINEHIEEWLGEKNVADAISQSVPHNVTSEMGLALLDVADAIRPYPKIINYLQEVQDPNFLESLQTFDGGEKVRDAISTYLDTYGMRCAGEIDITRTRWSENPAILLSMLLSYIKNFKPGESKRRFEQGKQAALKKEQELLEKLQQLPDGQEKAKETKRMIDLVRNLIGYREYPKYGIISRYFVYKQALLQEAKRLVQAGVLRNREDIFFLTFDELREVVHSQSIDNELIAKRKDEFAHFEKLTPPRVFTSDGESMMGSYKRENLPKHALVGLAVSSGVVEGRARVILRMEDANLEEGDILVTTFTDPSWTPLFVAIKGLVTEVGGLMTHGAVIAREYGLPAVVGVQNATKLIQDGQRIRVDGSNGYVEILRKNADD